MNQIIDTVYLSGISFYDVPPGLSFLWNQTIVGHCSKKWRFISQLREISRIALVSAECKIEHVLDEANDSETGKLTIHTKSKSNIFESIEIDLSSELYSIFWVVGENPANGFTSWKLGETWFDDDGYFCFDTKVKHRDKTEYWSE